jgi:curved DNA-binding protein CbpA
MFPKLEPTAGGGPSSSDGELPVELQQELLGLRALGDRATHYQVLGLDATADGLAIRAAYIDRSKRWHPDSHFRKNLGPETKQLLADAFRKASDAHALLADASSRAEYDASLVDRLNAKERAAVSARAEARVEETRRAEERRRRVFLLKGFARIGAAKRFYDEAVEHQQNGDRAHAVLALKTALELDPNRKEIQQKLAELEREAQKARLALAVSSGKRAEAEGQWEVALREWQVAVRLDPGSAAAHLGGAKAALATGNAELSVSLATRAVDYAPRAAEGRLILARAFQAQGDKARAKAALRALLDDHPDHKEARALLKSL